MRIGVEGIEGGQVAGDSKHASSVLSHRRLPRHRSSGNYSLGWLGSRVVSVLDSGAVGPGVKSQPRSCRVTVLGKLFTPVAPLFTKQQNW